MPLGRLLLLPRAPGDPKTLPRPSHQPLSWSWCAGVFVLCLDPRDVQFFPVEVDHWGLSSSKNQPVSCKQRSWLTASVGVFRTHPSSESRLPPAGTRWPRSSRFTSLNPPFLSYFTATASWLLSRRQPLSYVLSWQALVCSYNKPVW
uniref:Uncharacterized protein n=1 Tax=Pipistrellus kuhlii TaxID=59472 RepID=A0A7J7X0Y9_PIPKU|nr:hypothetical protein mPipKuh1_010769 [Pipistrellus kuhlii]